MKQNNTTTIVKTIHELSLRVSRSLSKSLEAIRELPLRIVRNGMLFALGFFGTTILAVAISGTIKTWTTGEVLKSADLNTTIASLKTAIEGIPNWTKAANGNDAYFTAGNVGIGTASPTSRLDLDGGELRIRSGNTQITYFGQDGNKGYIEHKGNNSTNEDFTVQSSKSGDSTNYSFFKIDPSSGFSFSSSGSGNGNVGIGTTSPGYQLTLDGSTSGPNLYMRNTDSSKFGGFYVYNNSGHASMFIQNGTGYASYGGPGSLNFGTVTNNTVNLLQNDTIRATINTNGYFGIGRTPTAHPLEVQGTAGLTSGTAWTNISDERLKDIDGTISSALDNLLKLNPIKYKYNEASGKLFKNADGKSKYGFTAQNVKSVFPEMVITDDKGYLWYNPSGFEAILTSAIKEVAFRLRSTSDSVSVVTQKIEFLEKEKAANEKKLLALEEDNKRLRDTVETMRATSLRTSQQLEDRLRAIENTQMARK
ncbi:MAG TPA: tail fiber domain-containing protein [Leptospiraceae bacterium]|nr:tail fiber domain-containing protein [Leptospiraceae bacterium]